MGHTVSGDVSLNWTVKKKAMAAAGAICLAVFAWVAFELWYSYQYLTVKEYAVSSGKIERPVRMVILSDLHGNSFGEGNRKLTQTIREQEPDAILMVGDMLNRDAADAGDVLRLIEELSACAPVYYALGNHENDYMLRNGRGLIGEIEAAGAAVLELACEDVEINGQKLRIGGMYDYAFAMDARNSTNPERMYPDVYEFLTAFTDTDRFTLMLSHRPDSFIFGAASWTWDIDLTVHGHAHGGQVVLPFVGGLWAGDQGFFPKYVHGIYQKDLIEVLVTSGLGSSRTRIPRFNNPPEIVALELRPEKRGGRCRTG